MGAHRVGAQVQFGSDLVVAQALGGQGHRLAFARSVLPAGRSAGRCRRPGWPDSAQRAWGLAGTRSTSAPPSALTAALAFRQAIWRKPWPGWHVCAIPGAFHAGHGSDFTSAHLEQVTADRPRQP